MPIPSSRESSRVRHISVNTYRRFQQLFHIEAFAGIVLVIAAASALFLANSAYADRYTDFLHLPISIAIGSYTLSQSLHFIINDVLMTFFFLVVGMEIRREIYNGALARQQQATLPIAAALGGILLPAVCYLLVNNTAPTLHGWAIPTATDIAFAVGVLALLGPRIPPTVRIFLLTLAIIDDLVAVMVIALFYSDGLNAIGFMVASAGVFGTLVMQRMGVSSAYPYLIPGAVLWFGLLKAGVHPTLAGVILGLLTPVKSIYHTYSPLQIASTALEDIKAKHDGVDMPPNARALAKLHFAQRELCAPVYRIQIQLHPWVAFLIMPIFAFANAGVNVGEVAFDNPSAVAVMIGICLALMMGKPLGVILATWLAIKLGIGKLPKGLTYSWLLLIGSLAGIGFTMSIFIANLAFIDPHLLSAAKAAVLSSSIIMAIISLSLGYYLIRQK